MSSVYVGAQLTSEMERGRGGGGRWQIWVLSVFSFLPPFHCSLPAVVSHDFYSNRLLASAEPCVALCLSILSLFLFFFLATPLSRRRDCVVPASP